MDNFKVSLSIKGLIEMLTDRIERLEKRIDELEEEKRASSIQRFEESKELQERQLKKLYDLIYEND